VATTWQASVDLLTRSEGALLNILAWLAPEPIPVSLLEGVSVKNADARDALNGLASWSLVRWNADEDTFTVHRLVQEITRQRLRFKRNPFRTLARWFVNRNAGNDESNAALESALNFVIARLPSAEWNKEGWLLWELLAPHCRALLEHLRDHALESRATGMMNEMARWLENRAEHGEAEPLLRRALSVDERILGPEDRNVAKDLNRLALILVGTNRLTEAEPLYRRALAIDVKCFGPKHPNVANRLNNLADLLRRTDRLPEAEQLFRRALMIVQESFGPGHKTVATGICIPAALRRDQRAQNSSPKITQNNFPNHISCPLPIAKIVT